MRKKKGKHAKAQIELHQMTVKKGGAQIMFPLPKDIVEIDDLQTKRAIILHSKLGTGEKGG